MELYAALEQLRRELPPIFAGTELDRLTQKAIRWRSVQNLKSLGEIPEDVFLRDGPRKLLVIRDPFLGWWQSRLTRVGGAK